MPTKKNPVPAADAHDPDDKPMLIVLALSSGREVNLAECTPDHLETILGAWSAGELMQFHFNADGFPGIAVKARDIVAVEWCDEDATSRVGLALSYIVTDTVTDA